MPGSTPRHSDSSRSRSRPSWRLGAVTPENWSQDSPRRHPRSPITWLQNSPITGLKTHLQSQPSHGGSQRRVSAGPKSPRNQVFGHIPCPGARKVTPGAPRRLVRRRRPTACRIPPRAAEDSVAGQYVAGDVAAAELAQFRGDGVPAGLQYDGAQALCALDTHRPSRQAAARRPPILIAKQDADLGNRRSETHAPAATITRTDSAFSASDRNDLRLN